MDISQSSKNRTQLPPGTIDSPSPILRLLTFKDMVQARKRGRVREREREREGSEFGKRTCVWMVAWQGLRQGGEGLVARPGSYPVHNHIITHPPVSRISNAL